MPHRPQSIRATLFALLVILGASAAAARTAAAEVTRLDLFSPAAAPRTAMALKAVAPGATFARLSVDAVALAKASQHVSLTLQTSSGAMPLTLDRIDVLLPGATITTTDDAGSHAFDPGVVCLRGSVDGEPGSTAVLTIGPAGAMGLIEARGRHWALAPVEGDLHRIADESQLPAPTTPPHCGMEEALPSDLTIATLPHARGGVINTTSVQYRCNLAIDCDYEWGNVKFTGNISAAMQYVMTMFGAISLIYERDIGTTIQLGYLNVWTTVADPYTQSPASAELGEFGSWWNANRSGVARTIAHLVSGRNLNGGYSNIGVLCDSPSFGNGYGVTSTDGTNILPNNVTSRDVWLLAHEVGHEFGAYHTQNCIWQSLGYVPVGALLDSCYAPEGGCYSGPTGIIPRDKGTIMSYCDQLNGGSQANDRLAFHSACADFMRQSVEASCMPHPSVQPPTHLTVTPSGLSAHLAWTPTTSSGVIQYDVFRSTWQLDSAPQLLGTTAATTWDDPIPWNTFYYRLFVVTASGQSDFGNEVAYTRCPLQVTATFNGGTKPLGITSGDFNEDGIADLAVTQNTASKVAVFIGQGSGGVGNGTYAAPVLYTTLGSPVGVVTADFNEDGIADLAVACNSGNGVSILLGQGTAGVGNGTFGAQVTYPTGLGASALVPGDFNEDGIIDLAVINAVAESMTPLLGQGTGGVGNGAFAAGTTLTSQGTGIKDLLAAEINGDGIMDLVEVRNAGARTLRGNGSGGVGNGAFLVGTSLAAGSTCSAIAAGDLNGDGIPDLVVAQNLANTLNPYFSIYLGNGTGGVPNGTYGTRADTPSAASIQSIAIADFTGDGKADVAVGSNNSTNGVLVYPGLGNGLLGGSMLLDIGGPVRSFLPVDVDNDGVLDIVAVNNTGNTISVIRTACDREVANAATVTAPNGGEIWIAPSEHVLTWTRDPGCSTVNLELSRDGGANWELIAQNVTGSSYKWSVRGPYSNQMRLRVSNAFVAGAADLSDTNFTIVPQNLLGVPTPAGVALAIRGVAPNPVRGEMTVTLGLPSAAAASLELIDVTGRRVAARQVASGAGVTHVDWQGLRLAPGIYVLRLEQGGRRVAAKVAVVE